MGAAAPKSRRSAPVAPVPAPALPLLPQTDPALLGAIAVSVGVQEVDVQQPRGVFFRLALRFSNSLMPRKLRDGRQPLALACQALLCAVEAGCGACLQGWVTMRAASLACLG